MKLLKLSLALIAIGAIGYGASVAYPLKSKPVETSATPSFSTVEIEQVKWVKSWNAMTHISGIVKAKRKSELSFERMGRVDQFHADKGDRVQEGKVLANLNTDVITAQIRKLQADKQGAIAVLNEMKAGPRKEVIDAARATVQDFDAQLALAKRNVERRQRLVNTEALSREDFEQAQSTVVRLEAGRTNAQKTLEDLALGTRSEKIEAQESIIASLQESILAAQVDLKHSEIRCPYDGIIIDRMLHEGSVASPGITVFVISEVAHLEAHFGIPPQMIASLKVGQPLDVTVRGAPVDATLRSIVPQVDDETRTLKIIAAITNSDNASVLAGDGAKLVMTRPQNVEGIWLRTACILQGQRGLWECFVAEKIPDSETSRLTRRAIEILHTEGDRVLVRGAIHDGDWVVSSAVNRVVAGQVVHTIEREMQ